MAPRFSEEEAGRQSLDPDRGAEALRRLGYCQSGSNPRTLKKWADPLANSDRPLRPQCSQERSPPPEQSEDPLGRILVSGISV